MRFLKTLKNKRGMALETAILFMIIIFSLCTLLTSLALIGRSQIKIEKITLLHDVAIDQIGEDYLASNNKAEFTCENTQYICSATATTLTVTLDDSSTVVLYVETDGAGNVITWRYS